MQAIWFLHIIHLIILAQHSHRGFLRELAAVQRVVVTFLL